MFLKIPWELNPIGRIGTFKLNHIQLNCFKLFIKTRKI